MNNSLKRKNKIIIMDDNDKTNNIELNKDNSLEISKQSAITNDDGSVTYLSQTTETKKGTGIISDPQKVEEVSLGVSAEDTKYVDAIRAKKELGVLFDEKLITYISVDAFEKILKIMDENLENYFDALSFGIYSSKEITELKQSIMPIKPHEENVTKNLDIAVEVDNNKLNKIKDLHDDIFLSVDKELERIKEEEERKRREEEERLRKLKEAEDEKKRMKMIRRKKIKGLFEESINSHEPFEIMKRRFKQYKEGVEEAKKRQKNKEMEEQRKLLRLKKQKEEEQKKKEEELKKAEEERKRKEEEERKRREEEERRKKEEEEKKRREEEERRKKEEEEKKRKEEEERIKKEEEEKERKRKEEEERIKKEEQEKERKKKEEEERKRKEEEEKIRRENEERIKREEEERKRKEEEERIKKEEEKRRKEEEERKRKEEEERIKKEEEEKERKRKEEEERIKKEEERKRKEEEERIRKEEEERIKRLEEEKKRKEYEERKRKEEEERIKREEEERKRKEEEERIRRENEEKIKREEEERKRKEEEEERRKEHERIKKEQEERLKKEEEERIKKEEEIKRKEEENRKIKEAEEMERRKKEEELKKQKELEEEELLKNKNQENKENLLPTLEDQLIYKSDKEEKNKIEDNKPEEKKKEIKKDKLPPTNEQKPKNLIIETNESKIPQKRKSKIKSQVDNTKTIDKKKPSKKPENKIVKKIIPTETTKKDKNKKRDSKPLITDNNQPKKTRNKSISTRQKKKDNPKNLMLDNEQYNKIINRYYQNNEDNDLYDDNLVNGEKRNKSAERRPIGKNLDEKQYIKIICNECGEKNHFGNYCETCKGPICFKCKLPHLIENPEHRYNINKNKNYISKKIPAEEKCTKCEKNLENKSASKCLNCPKELFCDECKINHNLIYPEHTLIPFAKEKNDDNDYIDSENSEENLDNKNISDIIKCFLCQKKIKFKDNNYITHCNKCKGNLCNRCENIHSKRKPLHKFTSLNTMFINDTSNIENYYKCLKCSKDLTNNLFLYNCPQCNGNLCNPCGNDHPKDNPKHKLFILKADLPNLDTNNLNCYICGRDSYNYCDKCKSSFCDKCIVNHKQKYPYHKIIIKEKNILDKPGEEIKNNDKSQNCVLCGKKIKAEEKKGLSYCDNCEGILCKNCIIRHKDYYPNHSIMDSKVKENLKGKKMNESKDIKIEIKYCHQCKRKLDKNIQYCFRCNEYYCDKCGKSHNFKFPKHKLTIEQPKKSNEITENLEEKAPIEKEEIISNYSKEETDNIVENNIDENKNILNSNNVSIYYENNEDKNANQRIKNSERNNDINIKIPKCKICGKYKNNQKNCEICKINLCQNCYDIHLKQFPSHDINNKEIKPKKMIDYDNENENLKIKRYKCVNCKKNMNLKNNDIITFCGKYKGNICENCKKSHFSKYPKHNQINSKITFLEFTDTNKLNPPEFKCLVCQKDLSDKINEPIATCFKCKGSLCKECSRSHISEFIRHKLVYKTFILNQTNERITKEDTKKNLTKNKNKCTMCNNNINFDNNENNNYCFNCDGIICENCFKIHYKINDNHKTNPIQKVLRQSYKFSSEPQNLNCLICNSDISNNIKNSIVFNCSECDGDFCDDCGKDHYINNPKHNLSVIKYILEEKIHPLNCAQCGKNLKDINSYKNCESCKIQLCIKCGNNHKQKYKYHNIVTIRKDKNIEGSNEINYSSNINMDKSNFDINEEIFEKNKRRNLDLDKKDIDYCFTCSKSLFSQENEIINHCFNCNCNFCIKCSKNHIKSNFSHDLNLFEVRLLKNEENKQESYNICDICGDTINIKKAFYKCENCEIDLCEKCIFKHYSSKQNHNFILVKYKTIEEEFNDKDHQGDIIYKKEYIYDNYKPNHDLNNEIIETKKRNLINSPINRNKNCCNNCKIKLNESSKNVCNYCKSIFCNECIIYHYEQNYDHRLIKSSSQKNILTKNIFSSKEQTEICNKCLKSYDYSSIYKCNQCKIKLCQECSIIHNKKFSLHNLSLLKNISKQKEENENNKISCVCLFCKATHSNFPNRFFYICSECNGNICSLCKKNHDNKFYSHILVFPHKYGEETGINKKHRRNASVG